jgi:hypothetical protein
VYYLSFAFSMRLCTLISAKPVAKEMECSLQFVGAALRTVVYWSRAWFTNRRCRLLLAWENVPQGASSTDGSLGVTFGLACAARIASCSCLWAALSLVSSLCLICLPCVLPSGRAEYRDVRRRILDQGVQVARKGQSCVRFLEVPNAESVGSPGRPCRTGPAATSQQTAWRFDRGSR